MIVVVEDGAVVIVVAALVIDAQDPETVVDHGQGTSQGHVIDREIGSVQILLYISIF